MSFMGIGVDLSRYPGKPDEDGTVKLYMCSYFFSFGGKNSDHFFEFRL